jgi:hypothetical protein
MHYRFQADIQFEAEDVDAAMKAIAAHLIAMSDSDGENSALEFLGHIVIDHKIEEEG